MTLLENWKYESGLVSRYWKWKWPNNDFNEIESGRLSFKLCFASFTEKLIYNLTHCIPKLDALFTWCTGRRFQEV